MSVVVIGFAVRFPAGKAIYTLMIAKMLQCICSERMNPCAVLVAIRSPHIFTRSISHTPGALARYDKFTEQQMHQT